MSSGELYDLLIEEGFSLSAKEADSSSDVGIAVCKDTHQNKPSDDINPLITESTAADVDICDAINTSEKSFSKRKMIYDALYDQVSTLYDRGADPKHVIERLMDRVASLTKEIFKYHINDVDINTLLQDDKNVHEGKDRIALFTSPWDHFESNAIGTGYPEFLYFPGIIRNTRMSRSDARSEILQLFEHQERLMAEEQEKRHNELLIRLEWERENKSELALEAQRRMLELEMSATPFVSFADSLEEYMAHKFPGNFGEANEFMLNIILACHRCMDDSVCRLFTLILKDTLSFETRLHQNSQLEDIFNLCKQTALDSKEGKEWITIETFVSNIRRICPQKGDISVVKLEKYILAAPRRKIGVSEGRTKSSESDIRHHLINFRDLLYGVSNTNTRNDLSSENKFVELFRNQHTDESILYADHIDACVSRRCSERVQPKDLPQDLDIFYAYVHRIREGIETADPSKSRDDVNVYLARGCGLSIEDMLLHEGKRIPVDLILFKKRLRHGLLFESAQENVVKSHNMKDNFRVNSTIISNSKFASSSVMFPSMSSVGFMSAAKFATVSRTQL